MAFQNPNLLPWRKVHRQRAAAARDRRAATAAASAREKAQYRAQAEALLKTVGLDGFGDRFPWELSGGMQQRVSLCRALIHQPALLMLDEPFAALDAFTREELWCVLRDLWQKLELHRDPGHARPARGGVPRRHHPRHERAARPHRHEQDRRPAAAARARHLLRAASSPTSCTSCAPRSPRCGKA